MNPKTKMCFNLIIISVILNIIGIIFFNYGLSKLDNLSYEQFVLQYNADKRQNEIDIEDEKWVKEQKLKGEKIIATRIYNAGSSVEGNLEIYKNNSYIYITIGSVLIIMGLIILVFSLYKL